jgi:hypothetical protein
MRARNILYAATTSIIAVLGSTDVNGQGLDLGERECPTNHLDWIPDGGYLEFLSDFIATLPKGIQNKDEAEASADIRRECSREEIGFYCESGVYRDTFQHLGLFHQFTAWACKHYACTDVALCESR